MVDQAMLEAMQKAIVPYVDSNGLVSGRAGETSGNGIMFSAEWVLILFGQDELRAGLNSLYGLKEIVNDKLTIKPGLYRRAPIGQPYSTDVNRWDDYVALARASAIHAADIVKYGEEHDWYFAPPGLPFDINAWFGRSPSIVAHFYWCAGLKPPLWQRLIWAWAIATSGWFTPQSQDAWRLSYLMIQAAPDLWPEAWAKEIWKWRFKKHWPGGMRAVRAAYFGDPNHPLSVYAVDL
jgi:hypothetical protein